MIRRSVWLALFVGGCGLVNSNLLAVDYTFDVQHFMAALGDSSTSSDTVPVMACDPTAATDVCASVMLPTSTMAQLSCDAPTKQCIATAQVRLPYMVDLSQQMLPPSVVQYTVDGVSVKKIAYWIANDKFNTALPQIDLYVAPLAAKDETDPQATLVGSMAMLPVMATACADDVDTKGDSAAGGDVVCDLKLTDSGKSALQGFVKAYQTPFQFIAHATVIARGGEPLPSGSIDYYVHPSVSFSLLK